uniref:Uncharacterized protein n=1 Tax=viral metagenome TaxID=1070528 RepID=A0A6M3J3N6_9ZZZZ
MKRIQKQIFFEMLHKARGLKSIGWDRLGRKAYLLGMLYHYILHLEDLNIAEGMRDYWRSLNSGAEL